MKSDETTKKGEKKSNQNMVRSNSIVPLLVVS